MYSRKYEQPIDILEFGFEVLPDLKYFPLIKEKEEKYVEQSTIDQEQQVQKYFQEITPPNEGCYITGLFLEGARWNCEEGFLDESFPKVLYDNMPIIWLKPQVKIAAEEELKDQESSPSKSQKQQLFDRQKLSNYNCPAYKTTTRAGELASTGHSTNFILSIKLKTLKKIKHWVKRGVALIASLDH